MGASASEGNAISVRDLDVLRGGKPVLRGISVCIRRGVVTGLLGPSGSGKTTLMRAIVGVQIVKSGHVTVLGEPAWTAVLRRRVAYVTQAPSVYGDLTVQENLEYFAGVLGASTAAIEETIAATGLTQQTEQVVRTLSGGERSRASLAVALLGDPELLVLDEPTVGLDPVLRTELWRQFHALAEQDKTVLVSTHVMDEAERCDDLVLMREGRIVTTGSPRTLLAQTQTDDLEQAFLALAEARS
jgi:ABC-2 type transport system ATP-binding protein